MTKEEFLLDMLEYFTPDPANRRCANNDRCYYSPKSLGLTSSEGCAIGRKLPPEVAEAWDHRYEAGGAALEDLLRRDDAPQFLKDLPKEFLANCQSLHDGGYYWDANGLSSEGRTRLNYIIKEFQLNPEPFKKFLAE